MDHGESLIQTKKSKYSLDWLQKRFCRPTPQIDSKSLKNFKDILL